MVDKKPEYCKGCKYENDCCDIRREIYKQICARRVLCEARDYPTLYGEIAVAVSPNGERIIRKKAKS